MIGVALVAVAIVVAVVVLQPEDKAAEQLGEQEEEHRRPPPSPHTPRPSDYEGKEAIVFRDTKAYSGFAVDDLEKAKQFYGETLGLRTSILEEGVLMQLELAGDRNTLVYEQEGSTPASCTILNFPVDDVEAAVDELAARGVSFERYDGFDQDEKGDRARLQARHRVVQGPGRQRALSAQGWVKPAA